MLEGVAEACDVTPESLARHMQVWEVWMPLDQRTQWGFGACLECYEFSVPSTS